MAKGSLFWGSARGKLGQVVLATVKGQQTARTYQATVANPKSTSQTEQRAKFANAVKFYKRSQQNLYKFAYEDKKKTESDYNAFMRHNTNAAMLPNKTSYDNINYPALANRWLLSYGSMPEPIIDDTTTVPALKLNLGSEKIDVDEVTIGQVSTALVSKYDLAEGDIVTFTTVISSIATIDAEPTEVPTWGIVQFVISTTSETKIKAYLQAQAGGNTKKCPSIATYDNGDINFDAPSSPAYPVTMLAVIFSRKTDSGLLVSTSYLYGNELCNTIYSASLQYAYRNAALNSWGRKEDAILQGSIASKSV